MDATPDMTFSVDRLDHVVINCRDVDAVAAWYVRVLGMRQERYGGDDRIALHFGRQKFNLRPSGAADWETAREDVPGSLDLCFVTEDPLDDVIAHMRDCGVTITDGPIERSGALGPMTSVYCRDPDGNLVEVASYG